MLARSSFVPFLQTKMLDPKMHSIFMSTNAKLKDYGTAFRMFDDFPCLFADEKLLPFIDNFTSIIAKMDKILENGYGFQLPFQDTQKIVAMEKEIIQTACFELLDNYNVRSEIIEFLKWDQQNITQEKIGAIVCAYVGAINQEIFNRLSQMNHQPAVLGTLCDFINKNYGKKWTAEILKENGYKEAAIFLQDKNSFNLMSFLELPIEDQVTMLGVGLAGVTLLIGAGFALFKKLSTSDNIQPPSESFRPNNHKM